MSSFAEIAASIVIVAGIGAAFGVISASLLMVKRTCKNCGRQFLTDREPPIFCPYCNRKQ